MEAVETIAPSIVKGRPPEYLEGPRLLRLAGVSGLKEGARPFLVAEQIQKEAGGSCTS